MLSQEAKTRPAQVTEPDQPTATRSARRYDVDWLRTLALGLLILYHVGLSFQSWAGAFDFPVNDPPLDQLWLFMAMVNVWRIPILFLISGMGVRFAMERRDWKALLKDRTIRILLPLLFGIFAICPISAYAIMRFYDVPAAYLPNLGHLWFLANIFAYVLLLLPLLVYLRNRPDHLIWRALRRVLNRPVALFLFTLPLVLEAAIVNPDSFTLYAQTAHGFWLGLVCFFTGFIIISVQNSFWPAVEQVRWGALGLAFLLYMVRLEVYLLEGEPGALMALESMCWMLSILGHGSAVLNRPSRNLAYLSKAVYPVYIVHLPVQFVLSYYLLPLPLDAGAKLLLLTAGTFGVSLLLYEAIRRVKWVRPLFGMKLSYR